MHTFRGAYAHNFGRHQKLRVATTCLKMRHRDSWEHTPRLVGDFCTSGEVNSVYGRHFKTGLMAKLANDLNSKRFFTTAYNSQSNNTVEVAAEKSSEALTFYCQTRKIDHSLSQGYCAQYKAP